MTSLDEALMALQQKWRLSSNATSNDRWDDGYQVACEDHADELAALLTTRQEVAPVADLTVAVRRTAMDDSIGILRQMLAVHEKHAALAEATGSREVEYHRNRCRALRAAIAALDADPVMYVTHDGKHGEYSTGQTSPELAPVADALTLSAPPKVWLQVDTAADDEDEREPIPRDCWEHMSWCHESIGGHEVIYIREDLASTGQTSDARDAELIRALRNQYVSERTFRFQCENRMDYENARAHAESAVNQFEASFIAARERHTAMRQEAE